MKYSLNFESPFAVCSGYDPEDPLVDFDLFRLYLLDPFICLVCGSLNFVLLKFGSTDKVNRVL